MTKPSSAPQEVVRFSASNGRHDGADSADQTAERPRQWRQHEPTSAPPNAPSNAPSPSSQPPGGDGGEEWTQEHKTAWAAAFNRLLLRAGYAVVWPDGQGGSRLGYHWGPLAQQTGLTINQLNAYARKGSRPNPQALTRLAHGLGVSPWLLMRACGYVSAERIGAWLLHGEIPHPDELTATLRAIEDMPDTAFTRTIRMTTSASRDTLAALRTRFQLANADFGALAVDRLRAELREQTAPNRNAQRIDPSAPAVQPGPAPLAQTATARSPLSFEDADTDEGAD